MSIIARNWISRKAIALVVPQATRFVDDLGFRLVANIRNLRALGGPDGALTSLGVKATLTEVEVTFHGVALRLDQRHAGSVFNIENHGENYDRALN